MFGISAAWKWKKPSELRVNLLAALALKSAARWITILSKRLKFLSPRLFAIAPFACFQQFFAKCEFSLGLHLHGCVSLIP